MAGKYNTETPTAKKKFCHFIVAQEIFTAKKTLLIDCMRVNG
jgi:hypothetical protein